MTDQVGCNICIPAKAGILKFAKVPAGEVSPKEITANSVAPGRRIATDIHSQPFLQSV